MSATTAAEMSEHGASHDLCFPVVLSTVNVNFINLSSF